MYGNDEIRQQPPKIIGAADMGLFVKHNKLDILVFIGQRQDDFWLYDTIYRRRDDLVRKVNVIAQMRRALYFADRCKIYDRQHKEYCQTHDDPYEGCKAEHPFKKVYLIDYREIAFRRHNAVCHGKGHSLRRLVNRDRFRRDPRYQRHKAVSAVESEGNRHSEKGYQPKKHRKPFRYFFDKSYEHNEQACNGRGYAHVEYPIENFLQHNRHLLSINLRSSFISSSVNGSSSSSAENNALRDPPNTFLISDAASTFCI